MSEEITHSDEIAPLTEEQWYRVMWRALVRGLPIQGLVAAKEFSQSMERIQQMSGHSQEEFTRLSQSIMEMAEAPEQGE